MGKLKYTLKNDILFKMLFVQYQDLLKRLIAELLGISYESIEQFEITNTEMPPETIGSKFCKLDINMTMDGQRVNLEIQVANEGDFPERSLFHWAREYSSAIGEGEEYSMLPRTIIIGIVYFKMLRCKEFHSEYQALEVTRHTQLTDKLDIHLFELPKLPKALSADKGLELWLSLFKARTEEELENIEKLGVSVMKEAIGAYRHVSATPEFRELERMRSKAGHDEAQALKNAEQRGEKRGEKRADKKWENVVANKEAENEKLRKQLAEFQTKMEKPT
jgi:predicted transposase/invertase (TIGR01784 family)